VSGFGKTFAQSGFFVADMMEELKKWDETKGTKTDFPAP
jgi:hypothetical protein